MKRKYQSDVPTYERMFLVYKARTRTHKHPFVWLPGLCTVSMKIELAVNFRFLLQSLGNKSHIFVCIHANVLWYGMVAELYLRDSSTGGSWAFANITVVTSPLSALHRNIKNIWIMIIFFIVFAMRAWQVVTTR